VDIAQLNEKIKQESAFIDLLFSEIGKVIVGQKEMVERLVVGLLGNGHILLEGVPGLAKTLAIKSLAAAMKAKFQRIQFTPDLLPADLIGTQIYNQKDGNFFIRKGPIFSNFILADEINRAPAKVQSALLEAMQERQVTIGEQTFKLDEPFLVLATQNPIEQEGTYPLPEAQLDRFMFNLWLDYPSNSEEVKVVQTTTSEYQAELNKVLSSTEIISFQNLVRKVPVADNVIEFAVKISNMTRPNNGISSKYIKEWVTWGAGPRASQYLVMAAKTRAAMQGRFSPNIDDIRFAMLPVLRHRIITNFSAEAEGISSVDVIRKIEEETKV
jgi:MoxR-like ATPase